MKKLFAISISLILCITSVSIPSFATIDTPEIQNSWEENFDEADFESLSESGIWSVESIRRPDATAPNVEHGEMILHTGDSAQFNWTKVPNVGDFDSSKTYCYDFDVKIMDSGFGNIGRSRSLYVAFGGWYNVIELVDSNEDIIICNSVKTDFLVNQNLNKTLHVKIAWNGSTITGTVYNGDGEVIISGVRFGTAFTDLEAEYEAMTNLVLRCEDGAASVDNFQFTVLDRQIGGQTELDIESGQQAVYMCDINYSGINKTSLSLGQMELISLNQEQLMMGNKIVSGTYGAGKYQLKLQVNPAQEMVLMDLLLPDGGSVRRGYFSLLNDTIIYEYADLENQIQNQTVSYADVTAASNELVEEEPVYTGFESKVYNLVSSFDDARTTRNFAWTADAAYLGEESMTMQYRKQNESKWTQIDAVKLIETVETLEEDYFQCSISELTPDTTYEYRIGKKSSLDVENDWSKTYTFSTAPESIDDFSFIVTGDTQGNSWSGSTQSNRGYMYAKAAYDKAFTEFSTEGSEPAFILHTGDVVDISHDLEMWNLYFKALGDYGKSTPVFATVGNHDASGSKYMFPYHFNHPDNGGKTALNPEVTSQITEGTVKRLVDNPEESIYSYDYGDAHFIVLNSGAYVSQDQYLLEAQRDWLVSDLESNQDAKWKVILVHEPVYHRLGGTESRPWLYDVIEGYDVDLVLEGHSHLVTRSYPMKDGKIVTKEYTDQLPKGTGTIYVTVGSTTLNHDGPNDSKHVEEMYNLVVSAYTQPTYTNVKVESNKMIVTTKQINGLVVDQFTIEGHEHTIVIDEAVVATCTESGLTEGSHCSECNAVIKTQTVVDALGHTEEIIAGKAPTCTSKGLTDGKQCSICGTITVKQTEIAKKEHTIVTDKAVAATCTKDGLTEGSHCSVCNTVLKTQTVVDATGHIEEIIAGKAPTCTSKGLTDGKKCSICGIITVKQTEIAKKEHTIVTDKAVAATCTKDGLTEGSHCSVCNTVFKSQIVVKATGHEDTKNVVTTKATTSKNGKLATKCEECNKTLSSKTIYAAKTVKLKTTSYVYNGMTKSPEIVIKDSKGKTISSKNYTVTKPSGRKYVGEYAYKIKFKNQYSGSKTLYLKINPKATSVKKLTASKKAFTVNLNKVSTQATGYEVMYATNSKFTKGKKTVKISSYKTTSKKITKLSAKKTYYVKVRTYKTVKGKKYYSAWSKVKTVKTK